MQNGTKYFVIDFDSTFTQVEALDVLAEISLEGHPEKVERIQRIKDITDVGMSGELTFRESLEQRLELLNAHKNDLTPLVDELKKQVSKSFKRNKEFFDKYADRIYIISNGFRDFIVPIVSEYHVKPENVFANSFEFDESGKIIGYDRENALSSNNGKVEQLKRLNLQGDVYVIGDGYTDYEIKAAGLANKFYAFTENVERENILKKADHITPSLDEFLYLNKMNTAISYPKNRITVLLLENIHPRAIELMKHEGYNVEVYPAGLDEDELCEKIKNVSILGIRSKTQVTAKVLESANRLIAVGAFCIGTNQIDLDACLRKGVAVFNAPFSNTRSVVEMAIAEIIVLMRRLFDRSSAMHEGRWDKSAKGSFEIRGKNLGIIGYGNIGAQLSVLAESLGLVVYYYDVEEKLALGNARKCSSLQELLETSDIVSLHVDGRPENKNMIGKREFGWMKDNVIFLNLSRGHVVDIAALKEHIENGKVAGTAVDVFPEEPKSNDEEFISKLRNLPNTILSPHVGGSTIEAQENIAGFVPGKIMDYINTGSTSNSVNFPNLQLPTLKNAHRLIHVHENMPGILARINQVLADHDVNIVGQYLKTNEIIGYVITDIDKEYDQELIKALRKIEHTIKFRVLY
ncbi:D-3-phosphoglycerate dehydrogenase [Fulvivirga imtechensis AK7]|uniref:D-3-phosphoglycerate dehydrogenase n=1 Tax=Fulvivirga imtechensis AK7 TaxID=1237149 RepID=L8K2N6_9BACT|nr:phosphoglycerate dehydrogenase [Fulvivirga imtechensis]ELR73717.1 D-3-phosphoglycerate dehydrogenase [Fulvivirga imtechensis AK7]